MRILLVGLVLGFTQYAAAEDDFENAPIAYSSSKPENSISRLQARLDGHELELVFDSQFGYLRSVLAALDIPVESQSLVFSKTSLQLRRISPRTPRAIYFNDDVYIGFCQAGDVLEVSVADPQLGAVFYTLDQRSQETPPRFERRVDNCLVCHSSSRTENVPGHLIRSLFVDDSGHPVLSAGSRSVNHTTPIADRWGGWYVTGEHGAQTHLGNLIVEDDFVPSRVENAAGQNVNSLAEYVDTSRYLSGHSDIVALMILEHQVLVHNRITNASFATRQALEYDTMMNKVLGKTDGARLESTDRRIQSAGEKLIDALLLVGEAPISEAIRGTSEFAVRFAERGPRDIQGRSLRDLDMARRMFRYPLSYLVYSDAFAQLPAEMQDYLWPRLAEILTGADQSERFAHLTAADRRAIIEILQSTLPTLPESWPKGSLSAESVLP